MAKLSAPNPAIFTSDPLEQIFAKGVTARNDTAGIAGAMMLLTAGDRMQNQDRYMGALNDANAMDAALAKHEAALKLKEQGMKSAVDLIKEGFAPSTTKGGPDLFTDTADQDIQTVTKMNRDLTRSKIFHNMQTGQGGAGGKDQVEETRTVYVRDPDTNQSYPVTIKSRSRDPNTARGNLESSMRGRTAMGNAPNELKNIHDKATTRNRPED